MIDYLKIANFGAIRDEVVLNFEVQDDVEGSNVYEVEMPDKRKLLKLAYIYGPNASGKSTILRAIEFLQQLWLNPPYVKDQPLRFDPFLFRPDPEKYVSRMELGFYMAGIRHIYEVRFSSQAIHEEKMVAYYSQRPTELFSRTTDLQKRLSRVLFGSAVEGAKGELNALATTTLHNNTVIAAFQKTNVDLPFFEKLIQWGGMFLSPNVSPNSDITDLTSLNITRNPDFASWINLFMGKADQQIREVLVKTEKGEQYEKLIARLKTQPNPPAPEKDLADIAMTRKVSFVHALAGNDVYALPLEKESSGSQRYYMLGGVLYGLLTRPSFAAIDELDTSLHVDLTKFILQLFLFNSQQSQLLFTTHNLSLLEDVELIRRDALWFTEKDETGAVSLFSAADFDSATLRKDASLINAYKAGRLGAKPNLGSPYITTANG
jgi:putative AbiEii toxin of type IV toxin-antitoxin system